MRKVVMTAKCPTCGAHITYTMNRCRYCGSDLYYKRKPGTDNVARDGDKVVVVRHEPVHVPSWSSQEGGQEYHGKGGTFTRPSVGVGYVLFPTEGEVEEWNNKRREHDARMARPYAIKLMIFVTICTILYIVFLIAVNAI